ncbi:DinB family protein [Lysinibacillus sp. BW-2-10]|uniref:DinB family protein n=1 Tax=Lysinibacillus sp. BW-2-10 TaxID=2590030 RepID=UPI00117D196C|nr:DinB family protein [Lysinibacillus sp. BW-2-10]TSI05492.1 damage-inducible protein DinB [Lysinibacillus sp. BW-2-10]
MYRKVEDFINDWNHNCAGTLSIFEAITEEKKYQAIVEGHSTLEWLSWHLTTAPAYFCELIGLSLDVELNKASTPSAIQEIVATYRVMSKAVSDAVKGNFTNEALSNNIDMHGRSTAVGAVLRLMVDHQTHHRAQMQVLLRQAGLAVPGVMGPTKEASR